VGEAENRVPGAPSNKVRAAAEEARPAPGTPEKNRLTRIKLPKSRSRHNKNQRKSLSRSQVQADEAQVAEAAPRVPVALKTSKKTR